MTRAELRALSQHADPTLARLADEALYALDRLEFRRAALAKVPTQVRPVDAGVVHTFAPPPEPQGAA